MFKIIQSLVYLNIFVVNSIYSVALFPRAFESDTFTDNDVKNGKSCRCIPSYFCADDDLSGFFGEGLLDIRSLSHCSNYFEVCCENPMKDIPSKNELLKGCGYKNAKGVAARITSSSQQTLLGELPWTIVVLLKNKATPVQPVFKCGGSLIHPLVVLTAAHCITGISPKQILIRAGEWDTKSMKESVPHQDIDVQEVVIHPDYNDKSLKNDIGLLFLTNEVLMMDNVGIICLPPQGLEIDNIQCTASGWGKNAFKKGRHSTILKKIDLPLIPSTECQSALRKTRLGPLYTLHKSFLCAGGEKDRDTCKGDGGSPLVCPVQSEDEMKNGRYYQIGIVSWGIGCGETQTPGVYVNLPLYTEWIDAQLSARNLDTNVNKY